MDENTADAPVVGAATDAERTARRAGWARPAALGAAGLLAGGLLAGTLSAAADDSATTGDGGGTSGSTAPARPGGSTDPSQPQRGDEELLTGSTASKVEAAALAEYPGATVVRIESDSDGVYEAHLTTASGEPVTVEVGKDFTVTGTEARGGPGGGPGASDGTSGGQGSTGTDSST